MLVNSAFNKEIIRSITQSVGRFAAIAIISLLGAGVYSGLRMAAPDMRLAGDEFFDGTNLYDLCVVTDMGLDDGTLDALRAIDGVGAVMPAYKSDAMALIGENSYAAAVESLPVEAARASDVADGVHARSSDEGYLNRPILLEGSWPDAADECVVGVDAAHELGIAPGQTITLQEKRSSSSTDDDGDDGGTSDDKNAEGEDGESGNDDGDGSDGNAADDDDDDDDEPTFSHTELTVTGLVNSSLYCSSSMLGTTSLGTGELELYLFTPPQTFNGDLPYSVAYLSVPAALDKTWDSQAYDDAVNEVKSHVQEAAPTLADQRYETIRSEAQDELDDARDEYLDERADAEADLDDARKELEDAQQDLEDASAELADAQDEITSGRADLESARKKLADAYKTLTESRKQLDDNRKKLTEARDKLQETYAQIEQMRQAIEAGLMSGQESLMQYEYARSEYEKGLKQYEEGLAAYNEGLKQYEAGVDEYNKGKASYEKGLEEYQSGVKDYESGVAEYNDGVAEFNDGKKEYEDGYAEAQEEFADAERELADAQKDIDDLDHPEVFVLDRSKNMGVASLASDSDGIDQIALFLPFMFFLVAALVSLTSMTRMVDEERLNIGTHKALGYGKARITSKYLIYAALASGLGSVAGTVLLGKLLPYFILVSYGVSYAIPVYATPLQGAVAARAIGLSVGVTLAATWWAAASTLRAKPAELMLPRVPKAGKRIFLERITPLWQHMSFSQKVTARNLLRYKRRFFMAVIGVAGCTALLMVGFGLRDAIGGIVSNQYQTLVNYDAAVRIEEDMTKAQHDKLVDELERTGADGFLESAVFNFIAEGADDDLRIEVVVPSDPEQLPDFVTLRDRATAEPIELEPGSILLTEKAAETLGAKAGDDVRLFDENDVGDKTGSGRRFKVGGIIENYLGHFAYLLPEDYRAAFGEEPPVNMVYAKLAPDADAAAFSDALLGLDGVNTVSFVSDKITTYEGMLDVMNKLIYVIMGLSAALAFVVLYNLTNINIAERVREIATLKVLGFTKGEVNTYIFREIGIMSLIGALIGCVLGVPLTFYIAQAAETANMMFGRTIEPASFALSFVLTIVFAAIVAFAMRGKLTSVNMVESLKSVE